MTSPSLTVRQAQRQIKSTAHVFLLQEYERAVVECTRLLEWIDVVAKNGEPQTEDWVRVKRGVWMLYCHIAGGVLRNKPKFSKIRSFDERWWGFRERGTADALRDIWQTVLSYNNTASDLSFIDSELVVVCVLLSLNENVPVVGREIVEAWLASLPDEEMEKMENGQEREGYEKIVELFVLHVLARLEEWDYAKEFLHYNEVISPDKKKVYENTLEKLHQKTLKARAKAAALATPPRRSANSKHPSPPSTPNGKHHHHQNGSSPERANGYSTHTKSNGTALAGNQPIPQPDLHALTPPPSTLPSAITTPTSSTSSPRAGYKILSSTTTISQQPRQNERAVKRFVESLGRYLESTSALPAKMAAFLLVLLIIALSGRGRVWEVLKVVFLKIWTTFKMGTTITYM
ncbi:uncharacterized protein VTP21DRAFT_6359 [Calcarisporiella thermophila]|uniref:uncharacterized protein n=1 Tax=Calcarisporiella thermophila TaxID=911321 RepID=UPI0037425C27